MKMLDYPNPETTTMRMQFNGKGSQIPISSIRDARRNWITFRDETGIGASDVAFVLVSDNGKQVARISYNGRVWNPTTGEEITDF
jgi:hypothetical protein